MTLIFGANRADSWMLKTQRIVDELRILARTPDCACFDDRTLSPKLRIWVKELSSAWVGMLTNSSKRTELI